MFLGYSLSILVSYTLMRDLTLKENKQLLGWIGINHSKIVNLKNSNLYVVPKEYLTRKKLTTLVLHIRSNLC